MESPLLDPDSAWVASKLQCGLGNRLFQLSVAHTISEQWNRPLVFAMPYICPSEHGSFDTIFKLFPRIPKVWKAQPELAIEQEEVFVHRPLPAAPPANRILLKGFWQAAAYSSDTFQPSWDAIEEREALLERWKLTSNLQQTKTAFLHVRLGDFKLLPHHQVNLLLYFAKAIDSFPADTRFLVFSDSIDEARALPVLNICDRCVFVDEKDEYTTLFLMTRCQAGAIIANSTFSWWGAFFGRQAAGEKDVYRACMPARWMANCSPETTKDIYPHWAAVLDV